MIAYYIGRRKYSGVTGQWAVLLLLIADPLCSRNHCTGQQMSFKLFLLPICPKNKQAGEWHKGLHAIPLCLPLQLKRMSKGLNGKAFIWVFGRELSVLGQWQPLFCAPQREKLKVKTQQLVEKVRRSPHDNGSFEVQGKLKKGRVLLADETFLLLFSCSHPSTSSLL